MNTLFKFLRLKLKLKKTNNEDLLQELYQIKFWRNDKLSICGHLSFDFDYDKRNELFKSWPKFSGNPVYPVPSPNINEAPGRAFMSLSKWSGKYGQLRKELLNHMILSLEQELKQ